MTSSRDVFLERVRQAVAQGNRAGHAAALEPRGSVGYQGAGTDPVTRFREELTAAGGQAHLVPDQNAAVARVLELVQYHAAQRVLLGRGPIVDCLPLAERLRAQGVEVNLVDTLPVDASRDAFFRADLGISGALHLIAETGTVVLAARPQEPRSLCLLPRVQIALATRTQLLADLFDLFESRHWGEPPRLPSCLSLITGPSKTGDIELCLVTGVHGPDPIHVVLLTGPTTDGGPQEEMR